MLAPTVGMSANRPHVVVLGAGFGGIAAARALSDAPADVTVLDRNNYHLFTPLLYQVATAGLAPSHVASPVRAVLSRQSNTRVRMAYAVGVDLHEKRVLLRDGDILPYDYLVIAAGSQVGYFGNPEWAHEAVGLKTVEDALEIRRRVLLSVEKAEVTEDEQERKRLVTFAVVGAGPTGVEMAGALAELTRRALVRDCRKLDPSLPRVVLVEMADRVLPPFSETSSEAAREQLEELGVEIQLGTKVTGVSEQGLHTADGVVPASVVVWATGIKPAPLAKQLDVDLDGKGRIPVREDCSLASHPEVFAIGDIARCEGQDGEPLPALAATATQQGSFVGEAITRELLGEERGQFTFENRGLAATVGRSRAVVETARAHMRGFSAWVVWTVVHIWYLMGRRARLAVMFEWFWAWATYERGARLILDAPAPREELLEQEARREQEIEDAAEPAGAWAGDDGADRVDRTPRRRSKRGASRPGRKHRRKEEPRAHPASGGFDSTHHAE